MDIRNFFSAKPKKAVVGETKTDSKPHAEGEDIVSKPKTNKQEDTKNKISPEANNNKNRSKNKSGQAKSPRNRKKSDKPIQIDKGDSDDNTAKKDSTPKKKQSKSDEKEKAKEKSAWKDKLCEDNIYSIDDSDDEDFSKSRSKNGDKKKRGRKSKKVESEEDVEVMDVSEDDDVIHQTKTSKKRAKKKGKAKTGLAILDSDSEKEEKPKRSRAGPKPRKRNPHGCLDNSDEEHQVSITEAFQHTKAKELASHAKAEKKQSPVKKKLVSAADFFGTSAAKQTDKQTLAVKRKAEESPVKEEKNGEDDFEIHDDEEFEKTLAALDEKQPSKKIKREDGSGEPAASNSTPGKSLAAKLSQKAAEKEHFVAETPERDMGKRPIEKKTLEKPKTPSKSPTDTKKVTPTKKTTPSKTSTSPKEAAHETPTLQKKGSQYRSYMQREGPRALGSKEIPEGADNCMEGLNFVITGVLESMERDECKTLIERYGGKVTGGISKKTSYLVIGRDPGESKTAKATTLGKKQIDEDALLDLVRTLPGKKSKYEIQIEKEMASAKKSAASSPATPKPSQGLSRFAAGTSSQQTTPRSGFNSPNTASQASSQSSQLTQSPQVASQGSGETLLWVDKYKPQTMKQIIGQQGDKSNANKLLKWIKNWHRNVASGKKPAFNRFQDDGSGHRAALLSGPPGVGKTTTSTIVCKEAGFSYVELNASDNRSKKSLKTEVAEALGNHTLVDFFGGAKHVESTDGKKHALIMDEVDGMAGNEDRGGMQELIALIKSTKIPIICMCNDRNHPKVRSLANYCFDLRFQRPRLEQIKSAMMSIAYKEGIKVPPPALNDVIAAANQDIRQVLNNLSMWSSDQKSLSIEQVKKDSSKARKDMHIGPFEVVRKVFAGGEETANMTINDKADLFFQDYSFGPLFVQENYMQVTPYSARGSVRKHLEQLSKAADSIADGDLVSGKIRSTNNWSLLPTQAIFSSVIPGDMMRGTMGGMINFPQWLGKNSSTNKTERILGELRNHMCLKISADKRALNTDYSPHLRHKLTTPLQQHGADGVRDVIDVMDHYDLLREDMDGIIEISSWPGMKDPMAGVESKVKANFTRTFNKEAHMTPYAVTQAAKKGRGRKGAATEDDPDLEMGEGEETTVATQSGDESDDDVTHDAMIKAKKKTAPKGGKAEKADTGKGKGKAGGKGTVKGKGNKK